MSHWFYLGHSTIPIFICLYKPQDSGFNDIVHITPNQRNCTFSCFVLNSISNLIIANNKICSSFYNYNLLFKSFWGAVSPFFKCCFLWVMFLQTDELGVERFSEIERSSIGRYFHHVVKEQNTSVPGNFLKNVYRNKVALHSVHLICSIQRTSRSGDTICCG